MSVCLDHRCLLGLPTSQHREMRPRHQERVAIVSRWHARKNAYGVCLSLCIYARMCVRVHLWFGKIKPAN